MVGRNPYNGYGFRPADILGSGLFRLMSYIDFENLVFLKGAGETSSDLEDCREADFFVALKLAKKGQVLTRGKAFRVAFLRFDNPDDRVDVDLVE